jgi:hypothetical protein
MTEDLLCELSWPKDQRRLHRYDACHCAGQREVGWPHYNSASVVHVTPLGLHPGLGPLWLFWIPSQTPCEDEGSALKPKAPGPSCRPYLRDPVVCVPWEHLYSQPASSQICPRAFSSVLSHQLTLPAEPGLKGQGSLFLQHLDGLPLGLVPTSVRQSCRLKNTR